MVKMEVASCPSCERKVDTRGKAMLQLESLALLASSSVELQLLDDALPLLSLLEELPLALADSAAGIAGGALGISSVQAGESAPF